jgi:predicted transcriptional regulator
MAKRKVPKPSKAPSSGDGFSRREREIMDALYKLGKASAAQILEEMQDPPTYTAIRTHLTILEKKGHIRHASDGTRYIYEPRVAREQMGRRAMETLLETFYGNSVERVVAALLNHEAVSSDELERLARLIEKAKEEGR